jgi:streptogramin lyase
VRLLALTAAVAALIAAPAAAAPAVDGVFDMPGVTTNGQLTIGPDGNVWVALASAVARVQPDGTVTSFNSAQLNNALGSPQGGITSAGGFIWVSQTPGLGQKTIVKIDPANPALAEGVDVTDATAGATAMTTGPDGNVWVGLANKIVRFTPADPPVAVKFDVIGLSPKGMTSSSDGTLWITDTTNGQLLNMTTGGVSTPYPVGANPQFVGAGPNGQVAFGNPGSTPQQIGLLSPGGTPQQLDRPNGSDPFGVAFGNDGAYWIAEFAGNRLARVTTDGQLTTLTGFPAVAGQGPRQIVTGPNNTLWATLDKPADPASSKIARITGVEPPPVTNPTGDPSPTGDPTPQTTPPPPPPDKTPPAITGISLAKTATRVRVLFTLSEQATLKIDLLRAARGQRRGKSCLRPSPRRRKAKRCTRYVRVRALAGNGVAGPNTIELSTRKLVSGRYRVVFTATDAAANRSPAVTRSFKVAKK